MHLAAVKNKQPAASPKNQGTPVYFAKGLPGLEKCKHFSLKPLKDNPFFYFLQSADDADLGFILVDPFVFFPAYEVVVSEGGRRELEAKKAEELLALTTVTIADQEKLTTNLAAPLLFNLARGLGKQVIISEHSADRQRPLLLPQE